MLAEPGPTLLFTTAEIMHQQDAKSYHCSPMTAQAPAGWAVLTRPFPPQQPCHRLDPADFSHVMHGVWAHSQLQFREAQA